MRIISIFESSIQPRHSKQLQILYEHTRKPFGIERRRQQQPTPRYSKFSKSAPKSDQNPSLGLDSVILDFRVCRRQISSVWVGLTSSDTTNDYQSLRYYPRSTHRANGSIPIDGQPLYFGQEKSKKFKKSRNRQKSCLRADTRKSRYPKVRIWHSNVSAPSARQMFARTR